MFGLFFGFFVDKAYRTLHIALLTLLSIGTVVFHFLEGWRYFDAFYFSVITLATVGYGDLSPKTDLGKIAVMIYIVVGIGIFLAFVQAYFKYIRENRKS